MKHVEIREHVRALLRGSEPGTAAPSERDLVEMFKVARMTVRQALDALVAEGLLERVPGRGTYVADPRRALTGVVGLSEEVALTSSTLTSTTVWVRRRAASPHLAEALGVAPDSPVVHWRRLRSVDDQPACLADTWLPAHLADLLLDGPPESLYAALAARGRRPDRAEDTLLARTLTTEEAELLDAEAGAAVLCRTRRASSGGILVEATREVRRPDALPLRLRLAAPGRSPLAS